MLRVAKGRRRLGPLPVASLVGLEVVLLGAYLAWRRDSLLVLVLAGLSLLVGLALLVPAGEGTLGGAVVSRVGFALRSKVGAGGSERARVRAARNHEGHTFGVLEAAPTVAVVVRVQTRRDRILGEGTDHRVPVTAILAALAAAAIPVDSVTTIARRADGSGPEVLVVTRIEPGQAASAITVRGGGQQGLDATLATVAAIVGRECRAVGLTAQPLRPEDLSAQVDALIAGAATDATTWSQGWTDLSTGAVTHQLAEVTTVPAQGRVAVDLSAPGVTYAVRHTPCGPAVRARAVLRVSDAHAGGLATRSRTVFAKDQLRASARVVRGGQRTAYLDTTVLGHALAPAADVRGGMPLRGWFTLAPGDVERLAVPLRADGVPVGLTRRGTPLWLDLVTGAPRRVLFVGDGPGVGALVTALAGAGLSIAVLSAHPAPWRALARTPALAGRVRAIQPGVDDPGPVPQLAVLDADAPDGDLWRPMPTVIEVRASAEHVDPGLIARCGLVIASAPALAGAGRGGEALGVPAAQVAGLRLQPSEVVLVEAGEVHVARLGS